MDAAAALLDTFGAHFGGTRPLAAVQAPGRVNLIGEHVDYSDGLVLPIAIGRGTRALVGHSKDRRIRIFSAHEDELLDFDTGSIPRHRSPRWDGYVRGVVAGLLERDIDVAGACIAIGGDLPVGAGLASSASLEIAVALGLLAVSGQTLEPADVADLCRTAEHEFAGVPCGIMDQLVCAAAVDNAALLIDCRDRTTRPIPWPVKDVVAVVIDSRSRHKLSGGLYAQRVRECAAALDHYRKRVPAVQSFRDLSAEQVESERGGLDDALFRRARHVVREIERTRLAAEALPTGDFAAFGELLNDSHESLRVDYEVSSPQLDDLAATARSIGGVFGARMTGAGFGGCVVALARTSAVDALRAAVRDTYDRKYATHAEVIPTRPCPGARVEWLDHAASSNR